jgi:hypothetical protein
VGECGLLDNWQRPNQYLEVNTSMEQQQVNTDDSVTLSRIRAQMDRTNLLWFIESLVGTFCLFEEAVGGTKSLMQDLDPGSTS